MASQTAADRTTGELWERYARTGDLRTREELIRRFEPLAYAVARRFARRGGRDEDLCQVALLGLVKAVDRFDPGQGVCFSTFATPTVSGEIRHYLRDYSWGLHVPRAEQELAQKVGRAEREFAELRGRYPTSAEIAAQLGIPEERARDGLALRRAHSVSLDAHFEDVESDRAGMYHQVLGAEDRDLRRAENRLGVHQVLQQLSEPLQEVIRLRYLQRLTQRAAAERLGMSAVHVGRLEKRALNQLRRELAGAQF